LLLSTGIPADKVSRATLLDQVAKVVEVNLDEWATLSGIPQEKALRNFLNNYGISEERAL